MGEGQDCGIDGVDLFDRCVKASDVGGVDDRHCDEGDEYGEASDDVDLGDDEEVSGECAQDGDDCDDHYSEMVTHAEGGPEEGFACDHTRGDIESEKDRDDDTRDDANALRGVT